VGAGGAPRACAGLAAGRRGHPRPAGGRAAARPARLRADRARERDHLRPLLRTFAEGVAPARGRAARVRAARRARRLARRAAVRRNEAAAHDRARARERARPAAARRADDRARSAGAPPRVGPAVPTEAARGDTRLDDALHGRGRAALRQARRDGQGPDRRGRLAARADRQVLDARGGRAPLPRGAVPGSHGAPERAGTPHRSAPRPHAPLHRRRRCCIRPDPPARAASPERPRAPLDARGRLPPPDRPHAGGRVTAVAYAFRSYEFWLAYYRRVWRGSLVSSFVNPVFYLAALGLGLGT